MRDYYYILGLARSATDQEIKSAYRKLSKKFHPDKNEGDKFFEERFKEIQEAYETLSDKSKRVEYDSRHNSSSSYQNETGNLKDAEDKLKKKFEEELQKKEADLAEKYNSREKKIKEESERKDQLLNNLYKISQKSKKKNTLIIFIIIILIFSNVFFLFTKSNSSEISNPNQTPISDSTKFPLNENISSEVSDYIPKQEEIILILKDNSYVKLSDFPDPTYLKENSDWRENSYIDINNDNIPELIINYFTGGAHCCVIYYIFKKIYANTYLQIFNFEGGENAFEIDEKNLKINIKEQLSYFFTCYSCNIREILPSQEFEPELVFEFKNNKFIFAQTNSRVNEIIENDLIFLKERLIPEIDLASNIDDGTRKAYAERLITFYFNNSRNLNPTKELFEKYYLSKDSSQIWNNIENHINTISDMNYTMEKYMFDN